MGDDKTTIKELKDIIKKFSEERDWDQYHNPKDLSIAIITEAAELLEHFRWKSGREVEAMLADMKKRHEIGEEIADVLYFTLRLAQKYNFDLSEILKDKTKINKKRYPIGKSKGSNKKYNEL